MPSGYVAALRRAIAVNEPRRGPPPLRINETASMQRLSAAQAISAGTRTTSVSARMCAKASSQSTRCEMA